MELICHPRGDFHEYVWLGTWNHKEVDFYISTSDVALCANSLKKAACSALLFLCSPGVEWKQFSINLAWFQLNRLGYRYAEIKRIFYKELLCHESTQNCCWVTLKLLTVFSFKWHGRPRFHPELVRNSTVFQFYHRDINFR